MNGMSMPSKPPSPPVEHLTFHIFLLPPGVGSGLGGTELDSGERIQLFDVAGLQLASAIVLSGGSFAFSSSSTGPLPPGPGFTDDPTIPNLVMTYTGPTVTATSATGKIEISTVAFDISGSSVPNGYNFGAETTDVSLTGGKTQSVSYGFAPVAPVPEPATWVLLFTAFPAGLWIRRWGGSRIPA
jgi:hypothetical protein